MAQWFGNLLSATALALPCVASLKSGNGVRMLPFAHPYQLKGTKIPYLCMAWMWDAV
jgi:hypothetical protein